MRHTLPLVLLLACAWGSRLSAQEPFDYFTNSWAVIGLKDYEGATRVTPHNELLLAGNRKLQIAIGPAATPLSRRQVKTRLEGWLPVILLSARQNDIRYDFRIWATPLPNTADWRAAFDNPTEGENYLNWIWVTMTNAGSADGEVRLQGAINGQAEPALVFQQRLAPGQATEAVWRIPYSPLANSFAAEPAQLWLDRTVHYWQSLIGRGAVLETPDKKANDALLASHVDQFINNDHGVVQGGEGFYDIFYIRDGAYEVLQFEEAGFIEAARASLDAFLAAQRPDGRFETQKGQLDANGQAIWTLWQYYQISGDRAWLELAYPAMQRAAAWTVQARRQAPADSPFAGLLPNALADGEYLWDGRYHIVGYDFWNLRGLLCTLDAARELGRDAEAAQWADEVAAYRAAIDAAWKRTGLPHFPPSWETAGTHWGNTETLWPTPLFAVDDPRVAALDQEVRHNFGGGFHEGTIRWSPGSPRSAIHPYMSAYTTMASLIRGQHEQVVEDFYWYLLHSTAAHAFPEGIYYTRRFAWSHTIPHATGASNYAFLLRHMLMHEQEDELHLLPAVPDWWLEEGQTVRVERAPTHFGSISFSVRGTSRGVELQWSAPERRAPRRVILHLPETRELLNVVEDLQVVYRRSQSRRWDFAAVVKEYGDVQPAELPGIVAFPLEDPPALDNCETLDLSAFANTDPFQAPFGVSQPGKFLFTGLRVGPQVVTGIPFSILDPGTNGGRGLIVLQGGDARGAAAKFPREIAIPVNKQGKRLFFLGNVAGWTSADPGVGDTWRSIAEYVIHYTDGQTQTVPLVLDHTVDDWAGNPGTALQSYVGLQGDPWHLNVACAELRPVPVRQIVFRDLGTVSAPLLAAVTLER